MKARQGIQKLSHKLLRLDQIQAAHLVAPKDVDEPVLVLKDGKRCDGLSAPGAVADAGELVDKLVEPLFLCPRPGWRLGETEGAFLVGDVCECLEEHDGLVEAAPLLGLEED